MSADTPRGLGRLPRFDDRSRAYGAAGAETVRDVTWDTKRGPLDQRNSNACTGYSAAHALNTTPLHNPSRRTYWDLDALLIYSGATRRDPWPETDFPPNDLGSSVLAACQEMKDRRYITAYRWCFGLDHLLRVLQNGPVILGTTWFEGMGTPDRDGMIHAVGAPMGGHAYTCVGVNTRDRAVRIINSWGTGWGQDGFAWLGWDDLDRLLRDQGEAVQPQR